METFQNPLETVQLIPIFNYLNILSDFLFAEEFLTEDDQNKQIPIVNALYEYLQHYENSKVKTDELIRNLLRGSDLYGEKGDEHFDVTFANALLDYIISSLVFDKYGNIYGFLANIFCKAENLKIDETLNLIIRDLQNASFENEYGDDSVLSYMSVDRIFHDIISPLFPQPNTNFNLLSLDYIYAQIGSMFLRPGSINNNNYINFESNLPNPSDEDLFDEHLITGYVIEKLIFTEEKNFNMLKAFAVPALTYYVFNSKYLFTYENMANVISDPHFWQEAYKRLFQYTATIFNDTELKLQNDYTLKMHLALSSFQTSVAMAETFKKHHCTPLSHLKYPESLECKIDNFLPNIKAYFKRQVNEITKIYETYDLQLVQEAFPKSLVEKLEHSKVIISLLIPNNNVEHDDFLQFKHLPYDLLEFDFPDDKKIEYCILNREDYNASIINQANSQFFINRWHFKRLYNEETPKNLKTTNESITVFFKNLVKYKTSRLQSYLELLDNPERNNKSMNKNWWKEFGLSLVPYYPCLSDTFDRNDSNICALNSIKFLYKYGNADLKLINRNTSSFLASLGTSIKSAFLKNATSDTVDEIVPKEEEFKFSMTNLLNKREIFEDIAQHIQDPAFPLTFTTKDQTSVLETIINSLKRKAALQFTSVLTSLSKISILKSNFYRSIGTIGESKVQLVFANTLDNKTDTGYGYKFIFLSDDTSKTALLRTDYELNGEMLLLPIVNATKNEKKYIALDNKDFKPIIDHIVYEINHQFYRQPPKVFFSGIPMPNNSDEKCYDNPDSENWKHFNICRRRWLLSVKMNDEEEAVQLIKESTSLSEKEIREILEKYTFPDNETLMQFINDWLKNNCLEPIWSRNFIIENPRLLSKLRYTLRFENHDVSEFDGLFRINSLYSKKDRRMIEEEASIETIIKNFNEQKATYSVTFHDYYAIRNFATTGYRRITRDTREAKLMKLALYKLAIRQSDDPVETFNTKLYRVESKIFPEMSSSAQYISLKKFTPTFPSAESAMRFADYPKPGFMIVMYEMIFNGPYVRAKIEQFYEKKQDSVILLPGSKFFITNCARVNIGGLDNVLLLTVSFQHTSNEKYEWHKNIMNQISRIQF